MEPNQTQNQPQQSKLSLPVAIVIAGILIGGAVIYSNQNKAPSSATNTQQTAEASLTAPLTIIPLSSDEHILGNPAAAVKLVEFSDPECPFCKQFQTTMQKMVATYGSSGDFAWVYRHFPIPQLHPKGPKEAEALECAAEQGGSDMFWKYTDAVYATTNSNNSLDDGIYNTPAKAPVQTDGTPYYTQKTPRSSTDAGQLSDIAQSLGLDVTKFESCLASGKYAAKVETERAGAVAAGGQGTPYSIFVLSKPASADAIQYVKDQNAMFVAQMQPGSGNIFSISDDKTRIGMSGALPDAILNTLITKLIANK